MRNVWRKIRKNDQNLGKMRKVELLPTRDCEAGYGPAAGSNFPEHLVKKKFSMTMITESPPSIDKHGVNRELDKKRWCLPYHLTRHWDAQSGGGHSHWKGVWGCAAVMTPFFQASRRSLAHQFTVNAPLLCPLFSIFRKFLQFQPCLAKILAL